MPAIASLLISAQLGAQTRLDCPRPVRETHYRIAANPYLELSAGFSRPVLYRNAAGGAGENYRFISRLSPYAAAIAFLPLSDKLAVYGGITITQTWQGLGFLYEDGYGKVEVSNFAGSLMASLPVGVRYRAGERLQLSAGPYVAYTAHSGQTDEADQGNAGAPGSSFRYTAPESKGLNFGLRLGADIFVTKRLAVSLTCAVDGLRAASSYSYAGLATRTREVYEGRMEPYLLHAAFGLGYRLFNRSE